MSVTYDIFANGMRVVSETLPGMESVAVAVSVGVGSRYETAPQQGLAHMLEHMAFKGTTTRSARDIAEFFDGIGGQFNAYTSSEQTVYYAKVLHQHVAEALEMLADIVLHSVFDEDELEREKGVVLQEIAMYQDTPDELVFDLFQHATFGDHPLGRSILGTEAHVNSFSADHLREFIAAHYTPKHIVLSAAGNVEHATFARQVEEAFGGLQSEALSTPEQAMYAGNNLQEERAIEQLHMVVGCEALSLNDDQYYILQLLNTMLGGGMSSRLFQEVREKRGLVYNVQSFSSHYRDTGAFGMYAATLPKKGQEVIDVMKAELAGLAEDASEEELERTKSQHAAMLLMARENTATVAEWMGRHVLQFGKYREVVDLRARMEAVTVSDIKKMAAELSSKPMHLTALGQHVESLYA
jgi:predicted Zn-dependent peptidase